MPPGRKCPVCGTQMIRFIPTPNVKHNIWVCPKKDKHAKILKDREDLRKLQEAQARERRKKK